MQDLNYFIKNSDETVQWNAQRMFAASQSPDATGGSGFEPTPKWRGAPNSTLRTLCGATLTGDCDDRPPNQQGACVNTSGCCRRELEMLARAVKQPT